MLIILLIMIICCTSCIMLYHSKLANMVSIIPTYAHVIVQFMYRFYSRFNNLRFNIRHNTSRNAQLHVNVLRFEIANLDGGRVPMMVVRGTGGLKSVGVPS